MADLSRVASSPQVPRAAYDYRLRRTFSLMLLFARLEKRTTLKHATPNPRYQITRDRGPLAPFEHELAKVHRSTYLPSIASGIPV